jgi:uncharacterized membrane protein SpoIIM required for sporulation
MYRKIFCELYCKFVVFNVFLSVLCFYVCDVSVLFCTSPRCTVYIRPKFVQSSSFKFNTVLHQCYMKTLCFRSIWMQNLYVYRVIRYFNVILCYMTLCFLFSVYCFMFHVGPWKPGFIKNNRQRLQASRQ